MKIETTMRCVSLPSIKHGYANGYVGVREGHPWYGKDYDKIDCDIHGGLTFAGRLSGKEPKIWWLGFDVCHWGDTLETCPKEYVESEIDKLRQYAEAAMLKKD